MTINFDSTIELTKDQIFSTISDKQIYEYYLNVSIGVEKKVICCFHQDTKPSLSFYVSVDGELKYKCFGCGVQGNSINFIKLLFGINYPQSLRKLQLDFNLTSSNVPVRVERIEQTIINYRKSDTTIIPVLKLFTAADDDYWSRYGITLHMLLDYNVNACERVFLVKEGIYKQVMEYSKTNPVYCYNVNNRYKIYRPLDTTNHKWLNTTTSGDVQGMAQLASSGDICFITSSLKDVMCLKLLGYNAIALESEGANMLPKMFDYLCSTYKKIIIFYDNDNPGIKYGSVLSAKLGIDYIHIPIIYKEKDISDFIEHHGLEKSHNLILELLDNTNTYK